MYATYILIKKNNFIYKIILNYTSFYFSYFTCIKKIEINNY